MPVPSPEYRISEVVPGVIGIDCRGIVWAYLLIEPAGITLIDTGLGESGNHVLGAVTAAGRAPGDICEIVVTHCHVDHAGALAQLAAASGAAVVAHELDAPVIRGDREVAPPAITEAERPYYERALAAVPQRADPAMVHRTVAAGDDVGVGGCGRVIHVPGHTPGSIAIHVPDRGLLFTGDAAACIDRTPIVGVFNIDREAARRSFIRLGSLDFNVACFGHGAPIVGEASARFREAAERLGNRDRQAGGN
jgi:glyoxylase-like metal-dependent hydrolase (beta-lactamase superfamily II)